MTIRSYTSDDFAIIEQWAKARSMDIHPALLSPNGFLVEDDNGPLMVCFVYLVFDVPFVFMDNLWGRPGMTFKQGRAAWSMVWRTTRNFLANLKDCNGDPIKYKFVRNFCRPELVRIARNDGWEIAPRSSIQVIYELP